MPSLPSLNTVLKASATPFEAAMGAAKASVEQFAGAIGSTQARIAGMVGAVVGLAGAGSLGALVRSQMDAIDGAAKTADQLGIETSALISMRHAADLAGVGNEEFDASLRRMQKAIGEASVGGGAAAEKFTALGLSVADLTNSSPDQQFQKIADAVMAIENPAQRAAAVTDIFGKQGQKLLNTMMGGADAMKQAAAEAEAYGIAVSRVDAAKVEAANDSLTRVAGVIRGVGTQLAVALAPYIEAAAVKFVELATAGGGIKSTVGTAVSWVASAIATAADVLEALKLGFQYLQAKATQGLGLIVSGLAKLNAAAETTMKFLGVDVGDSASAGLQAVADEMAATAATLDQRLADAWTGKSWGDKVKETMAGIEQASQKTAKAAADAIPKPATVDEAAAANVRLGDSIADLETKWRQQIDTAGLSADEIELWKLEQAGASAEALAGARDLLALRQAQAAQTKAAEEGKKLTEDLRTPLEKYQAEIERISKLQEAGAIDAETARRANLRALSELDQATAKANAAKSPQLASALVSGSQEALNAVARFEAFGQSGAGGGDVQKEQLAVQENSRRLLERIEKKFPTLTVAGI